MNAARNHALPPSPFAKRNKDPLLPNHLRKGEEEALQRAFNADWRGKEEPRSRTAVKAFGSGLDVDGEQVMHRSAIEELQNLQTTFVEPSTKTEHLINTKRTFEELQIRKSSSFDRDRIELSLSSDYVDFYSENTQLKRKIEELERNNAELNVKEQAMRIRMEEQGEKLKETQLRLQNAESQCSRASLMITEYENELALKEGWIEELKGQLAAANRQVMEFQEQNKFSGVDLQAHKNHFQNQKDSVVQAYEQRIRILQTQALRDIQTLQSQFSAARAVGQEQINSLLLELQKKEKENGFLRNTINQGLLLSSTLQLSQSLTPSTVRQANTSQKYMARFRNFAKMIDRKLFSSCDERDSNIFCSKVESKSGGGNGKRNKLQSLGVQEKTGDGFSSSTSRMQAQRHHQHHFSAN